MSDCIGICFFVDANDANVLIAVPRTAILVIALSNHHLKSSSRGCHSEGTEESLRPFTEEKLLYGKGPGDPSLRSG